MMYNSLGGPNFVKTKIITPIPKELVKTGTLEWKIFPLKSEKYDAIIGMNFLIPFQAEINVKNEYLKIFNEFIIPFETIGYPRELTEVNHLEPVVSKEEIFHKINKEKLSMEEKEKLKKLLCENKDLFYEEGSNLTFTHEITHEIKLKNENSIYCKMYRYPKIHEEEIERQIKDMLDQKIIKDSNSPYNSPLWIVPKKIDNSNIKKWRIVIDYRKLNEITIDDKFPIPNIDSILDKLGRAQYFTTLDLAKGFHQIMVKQEDQKKTAFSTPFGHYEYTRMPFGLKNAPATFQRLINSVLKDHINKICVVYLDDILIFSTSLQEHIVNINKIFDKLRIANLKIQIDKCNFFSKETEYLGHLLTTEGVKPNPKKIADITQLKLPTTQKQIKSFLGITGYYRKFIKDYAKIAQPMTKYLKKNTKINKLDPTYINAFEQLKTLLTSHPILKYPDFNKPFVLNTDASQYAIGAVLLQDNHPIAYASRTLNNHEINYSTTEKELLAVVWSVKYFRPYIYGKQFELKTDHQALKWLHTKYLGKDLNPRLQRWILSLGEYNIKINYLKGKENKIADFLSRINQDTHEINEINESFGINEMFKANEGRNNVFQNEVNNEEITNENLDNISMQATIHSQEENLNDQITFLDTIVNRFREQIIITENFNNEIENILGNHRIYINPNINHTELINKLKPYISSTKKMAIYSEISDHDLHVILQILIKEFPNTKFIKCRHFAQDIETEEILIKVLSLEHNKQKHPGIIALYENLKFRIYSKNLKITINKITNNCDICSRAKYDRNPIKPKFQKTELPTDKNQIIHIDTYVNRKQPFLIFIDKFTKFATAYPLENRTHVEIIEKLKIYFNHKKPIKLVADNEFKHVNIKEFLNQQNVELHLSKPNSHTGNSDVERLNNSLTEKLRILNVEQLNPIRNQMLEAINTYNNQYHNTIKCTPLKAEEIPDKEVIYNNLEIAQRKRLEKHNKNREEYTENREQGYIKNYKSLRHKDEPKYRQYSLNNIHPINIKRQLKFTDNTDSNAIDIDNNYTSTSTTTC